MKLTLSSERIAGEIQRISRKLSRPVIVAVNGGSGAGKTTLADVVQTLTNAAVVRLDDFYTTVVPEHRWASMTVQERLKAVFDWDRLREVLILLRAGQPAEWHAFDFASGLTADGKYRSRNKPTTITATPVILLDGAYSASPPVADLIDMSVLIQVGVGERRRRTERRDGTAFQEGWRAIWGDVEDYYYSTVRPPNSFDFVVVN